MNIIIQLGAAIALFAPSYSAEWDYKSSGPYTWGADYPKCTGQSQSPINIGTQEAEHDKDLPIVNRRIFDSPPTKMKIQNNGHSLVVAIEEGAYSINDATLLPFEAEIAQFHFHWARNYQSGGSEHTIDGKRYFGELHAVHYNTKYGDVATAIDKSDGLAVFGWFIDVDYPQDNQDYELLFQLVKGGVTKKGDVSQVNATFSLETLLPADLTRYYRYQGSLTTPGCYESVVWTVFEEPIRISESQASFLSGAIMDSAQMPIQDNFRPVQALNGRKVTKALGPYSGGRSTASSVFLLVAMTFLSSFCQK